MDNPYFELPEELKNRHLYLTKNNGPLELDEFSDLSPRFVRELLIAERAHELDEEDSARMLDDDGMSLMAKTHQPKGKLVKSITTTTSPSLSY